MVIILEVSSQKHLPSGFLLVKQVEKYKDGNERLEIAKQFVNSASHNILKNVKYCSNRKEGLEGCVARIEDERENIKEAKISELME